MKIRELSILIPTYNGRCTELADHLRQQAAEAGIDFEVIVADDASTDEDAIAANRVIGTWPQCRYIQHAENMGRAANRNFLARTARYEWLLFADSHMSVARPDYINRYASQADAQVVNGGVEIGGDAALLSHNLRYRYEKSAEHEHTPERRQLAPYRDFHTANFLIRRDVMLAHPFDERFRRYGYEDVIFGKQLKAAGIRIAHIDNPLGFCTFEDNPDFIRKTEEGLQTLHQFRAELRGYSRLLTFVEGIHITAILWLIRLWHRLFGQLERRNLCSRHPLPRLLTPYKLGYYLTLFK